MKQLPHSIAESLNVNTFEVYEIMGSFRNKGWNHRAKLSGLILKVLKRKGWSLPLKMVCLQ